MKKEPKGTRVYFRVAENFKNQFVAAALTNEQDPSEAFRYIGRQFVDRVKQEKPEEFLKKLQEVRAMSEASSDGNSHLQNEVGEFPAELPTPDAIRHTQTVKLAATTPRTSKSKGQKKAGSK